MLAEIHSAAKRILKIDSDATGRNLISKHMGGQCYTNDILDNDTYEYHNAIQKGLKEGHRNIPIQTNIIVIRNVPIIKYLNHIIVKKA